MSLLLSMAAFALAASISPGPVNIVALSSGAQYGFRPAMRHVTGATVGFTLLLILIGMGLNKLLANWPWLTDTIRLSGVAFLLCMAYRLAINTGELSTKTVGVQPSLIYGATMQWLNPKAWIASMAGMAAFAESGQALHVWRFAAVYFIVCYGSVTCWAYAGSYLGHYLNEPRRMRLFNRTMAALLAGCAMYLLSA